MLLHWLLLPQVMGSVFSRESDLPRGLVSLNIMGGPGATKEQGEGPYSVSSLLYHPLLCCWLEHQHTALL